MNLVLHIPHRTLQGNAGALRLAQRAPTFTIEWLHDERVAVAIFPSLPEGIDLAVQLVGESMGLADAWASLNARPMSNLVGFWHRLVCYRDSLTAADPVRYCRERSIHFNALVACSERHERGICQFIAMPCGDMMGEGTKASVRQLEVAARLAEIDWCPRLHLRPSGLAAPRPISPGNGTSVRT
jgi:hypothetical protein